MNYQNYSSANRLPYKQESNYYSSSKAEYFVEKNMPVENKANVPKNYGRTKQNNAFVP